MKDNLNISQENKMSKIWIVTAFQDCCSSGIKIPQIEQTWKLVCPEEELEALITKTITNWCYSLDIEFYSLNNEHCELKFNGNNQVYYQVMDLDEFISAKPGPVHGMGKTKTVSISHPSFKPYY